MKNQPIADIDEYISSFSDDVQKVLLKIRQTIKKAAPEAVEAIKYGIPTFVVPAGNLVHFAAYKSHIGFYPSPSGIEKFKDEFASYKTSKGAVQFPLDSKIPFALIKQVVEYRVEETSQTKSKAKRQR